MRKRKAPETVEERADAIVEALGGTVVKFSLRAESPFANIPDRRYRVRGVALWAELKRPLTDYEDKDGYTRHRGDLLTQGQLDFLRAEYDCGQIVFAGSDTELKEMLLRAPSGWYYFGWQCVALTATKGLRKERAK